MAFRAPGAENLAQHTINMAWEFQAQANQFLIDAARAGNVVGIKGALAAGADPNFREVADGSRHNQEEGRTPLMYACWAGPDALEGVNALIAAGADVNAKLAQGNSPIMFAAQGCAKHDNYEKDGKPLIDALVAAGADPKDGFSNGKNALFICLNEYDGVISTSALKALLSHGANPNTVVNYDSHKTDILSSATWIAQQSNDQAVEAVKVLVEAGANVNPQGKAIDHLSSTPIGAAAHGRADLVGFLLEKGANPDVVTTKGEKLIDFAKAELAKYKKEKWDSKIKQGIVDALESALQKSPDGQGQHGDEAVRTNPEQDKKRSQG